MTGGEFDVVQVVITSVIASVCGAAVGGFSAYVAIKTNLAELNARVLNVEKGNDRAHDRLDGMQHRRG